MPHKHIKVSQTGFQGRPHDDHEHLKIQRLSESSPTEKSHYLLATLNEFHAGKSVPLHYPSPAVVYIVEGELHVEDNSKPGEVSKLLAGDVIHINEGTSNTFATPNYVKFLGVAYTSSHLHPEDFIKE